VRDSRPNEAVFCDVAHPTGTTRMADDPKQGVVDRNCRLHGVEGIYIAGSSVFPTAGHANPTLMIVALALRLADRLKQVHFR
jgi:choline dehydrogenase-like flavoprotein